MRRARRRPRPAQRPRRLQRRRRPRRPWPRAALRRERARRPQRADLCSGRATAWQLRRASPRRGWLPRARPRRLAPSGRRQQTFHYHRHGARPPDELPARLDAWRASPDSANLALARLSPRTPTRNKMASSPTLAASPSPFSRRVARPSLGQADRSCAAPLPLATSPSPSWQHTEFHVSQPFYVSLDAAAASVSPQPRRATAPRITGSPPRPSAPPSVPPLPVQLGNFSYGLSVLPQFDELVPLEPKGQPPRASRPLPRSRLHLWQRLPLRVFSLVAWVVANIKKGAAFLLGDSPLLPRDFKRTEL
jgi:hypothetical protein